MREMLSLLKRAGLNEYESKTYYSLLKLNEAGASSISKNAGIPRARVYDVLMGLEKKGFVVMNPSRPIKFRALDVKTALGNLEKARRKEFEESMRELKDLSEKLGKRLEPGGTPPESGEKVWLLRGKDNIYSAIENELNKSREEVIISTSEANAVNKLNAFKQKLDSLEKKGVKLSLGVFGGGEKLKESFGEVSYLKPSPNPARYAVFDNRNVMLFLNEGGEEDKAIFLESPFVAKCLKKMG